MSVICWIVLISLLCALCAVLLAVMAQLSGLRTLVESLAAASRRENDARFRTIETALRRLPEAISEGGGDITSHPYRSPANRDHEPVVLPAHDPEVVNPSEWKPGMPCPFCLKDEDPDDPTEQAYRPVDGATAERPWLTWECLHCASQWNTGVQGQPSPLVGRPAKVVDVSDLSEEEASAAFLRR